MFRFSADWATAVAGAQPRAPEMRERDAELEAIEAMLAAAAAGRGRLLVVVDDLHWADRPSLRFLAYLVERVESLRVAVLVAVRHDWEPVDTGAMRQVCANARARVLQPGPLSRSAVGELVRDLFFPDA